MGDSCRFCGWELRYRACRSVFIAILRAFNPLLGILAPRKLERLIDDAVADEARRMEDADVHRKFK